MSSGSSAQAGDHSSSSKRTRLESVDETKEFPHQSMFTRQTQAIVYGLQLQAVQNMLDFDSLCRREEPSVACMVYPFSGNSFEKFYWKQSEVLIPIFQSITQAVAKHPNVSVLINFASMRSGSLFFLFATFLLYLQLTKYEHSG
jgi:ATP citrate (pro-S)-lyase